MVSSLETEQVAPIDLPVSWQAAVRFCPYCSSSGCERCRDTGDLMRTLLEQAYELGRDEAILKMRELYRVIVLAGQQLGSTDPPANLKAMLGVR